MIRWDSVSNEDVAPLSHFEHQKQNSILFSVFDVQNTMVTRMSQYNLCDFCICSSDLKGEKKLYAIFYSRTILKKWLCHSSRSKDLSILLSLCPYLKPNERMLFSLSWRVAVVEGRGRWIRSCSFEDKFRNFVAYSSLIKNKCGKLF